MNLQLWWRSILFLYIFFIYCSINNSFICLSDNKWRKYCTLLSRDIFWGDDLPPSFVVEKREREEGCDYSLRSHVLRATIGLSIPGLGSNFSSLRRIITESFPRQAASSANQRLALPLLPPWRAVPPTRGLCSAERQWKMWCEEFAGVINGPAPLPRFLFFATKFEEIRGLFGIST